MLFRDCQANLYLTSLRSHYTMISGVTAIVLCPLSAILLRQVDFEDKINLTEVQMRKIIDLPGNSDFVD